MLLPTIVTFTGLAPSTTLYRTAVEHAQLLGRFAREVCYCEVNFRANVRRCRDGSRFLIQVNVTLLNSGTRTECGIAPNAKGGQASLVLRQMLLALAQRIDDCAPCPARTTKPTTPHFPVL